MNILRRFQKPKIRPEIIQRYFLAWLSFLLQNAQWRAYIKRRLEEPELPVIEFNDRERRRVAK